MTKRIRIAATLWVLAFASSCGHTTNEPSALVDEPRVALGEAAAPVTLTMFVDYECPYSRRAGETIVALRSKYGQKLRLEVHQRPLVFHAHAKNAALAVLAAGEQGKSFAMHERLLSLTKPLDDDAIESIARDLPLDLPRFRLAWNGPRAADALARDEALASKLGADGTPTFFVNGRKLMGAQPIETFAKAIDEEIVAANDLLAKGTRPEDVPLVLAKRNEHAPEIGVHESKPIDPPKEAKVQVALGASPILGRVSAPVDVVVFSDFQCPYCAKARATALELEKQHHGDVRIVFKHKPLPFHQNAKLAAKASLAADEQGKFWPYHDVLFAHQDALDRASLEKYASELGLDVARFRDAIDSERLEARVNADMAEADRLEVKGTPTFFVNGRRMVGAQPLDVIEKLVVAK